MNEAVFIAQIYEPPLQYHYLKRPYTLEPLTAAQMPTVHYLGKNKEILSNDASVNQIAYTAYDIYIKPNIYFQPHPAFAKNQQGQLLYHQLSAAETEDIYQLNQFMHQGTRELTAEDYIYQIKRLAHPALNSPVLSLMEKYIVGLSDLHETLQQATKDGVTTYLDLRRYPLVGARVISRYHYQIILKGKYPQFIYWLAMPFFAPMPWEVDHFYSQGQLSEHNLNLDWFPVGTGPYVLSENNPNYRMVLSRNPYFNHETYPFKF